MNPDNRIAKIRARLFGVGGYSAALGPNGNELDEHGVMRIEHTDGKLVCYAWDEDADFILHAPADIAWLVSEVDRLIDAIGLMDRAVYVMVKEKCTCQTQKDVTDTCD